MTTVHTAATATSDTVVTHTQDVAAGSADQADGSHTPAAHDNVSPDEGGARPGTRSVTDGEATLRPGTENTPTGRSGDDREDADALRSFERLWGKTSADRGLPAPLLAAVTDAYVRLGGSARHTEALLARLDEHADDFGGLSTVDRHVAVVAQKLLRGTPQEAEAAVRLARSAGATVSEQERTGSSADTSADRPGPEALTGADRAALATAERFLRTVPTEELEQAQRWARIQVSADHTWFIDADHPDAARRRELIDAYVTLMTHSRLTNGVKATRKLSLELAKRYGTRRTKGIVGGADPERPVPALVPTEFPAAGPSREEPTLEQLLDDIQSRFDDLRFDHRQTEVQEPADVYEAVEIYEPGEVVTGQVSEAADEVFSVHDGDDAGDDNVVVELLHDDEEHAGEILVGHASELDETQPTHDAFDTDGSEHLPTEEALPDAIDPRNPNVPAEFRNLMEPLRAYAEHAVDRHAKDVEVVLMSYPGANGFVDLIRTAGTGHAFVAVRLPGHESPVIFGFRVIEEVSNLSLVDGTAPGGVTHEDPEAFDDFQVDILKSYKINADQLASAYRYAEENARTTYNLLTYNCVVFAQGFVQAATGEQMPRLTVNAPDSLIKRMREGTHRDWVENPKILKLTADDQRRLERANEWLDSHESGEGVRWALDRVFLEHQRPVVSGRRTATQQRQLDLLANFAALGAEAYHRSGEAAARELLDDLGVRYGTARNEYPLIRSTVADMLEPLRSSAANAADPTAVNAEIVVMADSGRQPVIAVKLSDHPDPIVFRFGMDRVVADATRWEKTDGGLFIEHPERIYDHDMEVLRTYPVSAHQVQAGHQYAVDNMATQHSSMSYNATSFARGFLSRALGSDPVSAYLNDVHSTSKSYFANPRALFKDYFHTSADFFKAMRADADRTWADAESPVTELSEGDARKLADITPGPEAEYNASLAWAKLRVTMEHQRPGTAQSDDARSGMLDLLRSFRHLIAAEYRSNGEQAARQLSWHLGVTYGTWQSLDKLPPPMALLTETPAPLPAEPPAARPSVSAEQSPEPTGSPATTPWREVVLNDVLRQMIDERGFHRFETPDGGTVHISNDQIRDGAVSPEVSELVTMFLNGGLFLHRVQRLETPRTDYAGEPVNVFPAGEDTFPRHDDTESTAFTTFFTAPDHAERAFRESYDPRPDVAITGLLADAFVGPDQSVAVIDGTTVKVRDFVVATFADHAPVTVDARPDRGAHEIIVMNTSVDAGPNVKVLTDALGKADLSPEQRARLRGVLATYGTQALRDVPDLELSRNTLEHLASDEQSRAAQFFAAAGTDSESGDIPDRQGGAFGRDERGRTPVVHPLSADELRGLALRTVSRLVERSVVRPDREGSVLSADEVPAVTCVTLLESLARELYPRAELDNALDRPAYGSGVRAAHTVDDSVLGRTGTEQRLAHGPGWHTVTSWRDLVTAVEKVGPGSSALILQQRQNGFGHAFALYHQADGVQWLDLQQGDGLRPAPEQDAAPHVRAVIVDPYGKVVPVPQSLPTFIGSRSVLALADLPTSHEYRGIGMEIERTNVQLRSALGEGWLAHGRVLAGDGSVQLTSEHVAAGSAPFLEIVTRPIAVHQGEGTLDSRAMKENVFRSLHVLEPIIGPGSRNTTTPLTQVVSGKGFVSEHEFHDVQFRRRPQPISPEYSTQFTVGVPLSAVYDFATGYVKRVSTRTDLADVLPGLEAAAAFSRRVTATYLVQRNNLSEPLEYPEIASAYLDDIDLRALKSMSFVVFSQAIAVVQNNGARNPRAPWHKSYLPVASRHHPWLLRQALSPSAKEFLSAESEFMYGQFNYFAAYANEGHRDPLSAYIDAQNGVTVRDYLNDFLFDYPAPRVRQDSLAIGSIHEQFDVNRDEFDQPRIALPLGVFELRHFPAPHGLDDLRTTYDQLEDAVRGTYNRELRRNQLDAWHTWDQLQVLQGLSSNHWLGQLEHILAASVELNLTGPTRQFGQELIKHDETEDLVRGVMLRLGAGIGVDQTEATRLQAAAVTTLESLDQRLVSLVVSLAYRGGWDNLFAQWRGLYQANRALLGALAPHSPRLVQSDSLGIWYGHMSQQAGRRPAELRTIDRQVAAYLQTGRHENLTGLLHAIGVWLHAPDATGGYRPMIASLGDHVAYVLAGADQAGHAVPAQAGPSYRAANPPQYGADGYGRYNAPPVGDQSGSEQSGDGVPEPDFYAVPHGPSADVARSLIDVPESVERPIAARNALTDLLARMVLRPDVRDRLVASGARVVILPRGVDTADLPGLASVGEDLSRDAVHHWETDGTRTAVAVVAEENLLGEQPGVPGHIAHPDGYSTAAHEVAHLVFRHGLSADRQERVSALYEARKAVPGASWPDGSDPRNYSASTVDEYFAQATNAYFGVNHGRDAVSGEFRNNGADWVRTHDEGLADLFAEIYGDPAEFPLPAANPRQAVDQEAGLWEGFRSTVDPTPSPGPPDEIPPRVQQAGAERTPAGAVSSPDRPTTQADVRPTASAEDVTNVRTDVSRTQDLDQVAPSVSESVFSTLTSTASADARNLHPAVPTDSTAHSDEPAIRQPAGEPLGTTGGARTEPAADVAETTHRQETADPSGSPHSGRDPHGMRGLVDDESLPGRGRTGDFPGSRPGHGEEGVAEDRSVSGISHEDGVRLSERGLKAVADEVIADVARQVRAGNEALADPSLLNCVVLLEGLERQLYPERDIPAGPAGRDVRPAAVRAASTMDDISLHRTDAEQRLVRGPGWGPVTSWEALGNAVADAGVGASGLIVMRRLQGAGHAFALHHTTDGVRWIDLQASQGGKVTREPLHTPPLHARAVVLDRAGQAVADAMDEQRPGPSRTVDALTDPVADPGLIGAIGLEMEDAHPLWVPDGVRLPGKQVLAKHPNGSRLEVDSDYFVRGADGRLYATRESAVQMSGHGVLEKRPIVEFVSAPLAMLRGGESHPTSVRHGLNLYAQFRDMMRAADSAQGVTLAKILASDPAWEAQRDLDEIYVLPAPAGPYHTVNTQFTVGVPMGGVKSMLNFGEEHMDEPSLVLLMEAGRNFGERVAAHYTSVMTNLAVTPDQVPFLDKLTGVDEVLGYSWLAFEHLGGLAVYGNFLKQQIALAKNILVVASRHPFHVLRGGLAPSTRDYLRRHAPRIRDIFVSELDSLIDAYLGKGLQFLIRPIDGREALTQGNEKIGPLRRFLDYVLAGRANDNGTVSQFDSIGLADYNQLDEQQDRLPLALFEFRDFSGDLTSTVPRGKSTYMADEDIPTATDRFVRAAQLAYEHAEYLAQGGGIRRENVESVLNHPAVEATRAALAAVGNMRLPDPTGPGHPVILPSERASLATAVTAYAVGRPLQSGSLTPLTTAEQRLSSQLGPNAPFLDPPVANQMQHALQAVRQARRHLQEVFRRQEQAQHAQQAPQQHPGYQQPAFPTGHQQIGYQQPAFPSGFQQPAFPTGHQQPGYQHSGWQQPGYPQPGFPPARWGEPFPGPDAGQRIGDPRGFGASTDLTHAGDTSPAAQAAHTIIDVPDGVERPVAARVEAERLLALLLHNPEVAQRLTDSGARVVVIPRGGSLADLAPNPASPDTRGDTEPRHDARGWTFPHRRLAAVSEENLLGQNTATDGYTHPEGYSSALHEYAHLLYLFAFTDDHRENVTALYEHHLSQSPATHWVDGPRTTTDGHVAVNHASSSPEEYFAQSVVAYYGANHGHDRHTGRQRNNSADWIEEHDPDMHRTLTDLFGPPPTTPLHANALSVTDRDDALWSALGDHTALTRQQGLSGPPNLVEENRPGPDTAKGKAKDQSPDDAEDLDGEPANLDAIRDDYLAARSELVSAAKALGEAEQRQRHGAASSHTAPSEDEARELVRAASLHLGRASTAWRETLPDTPRPRPQDVVEAGSRLPGAGPEAVPNWLRDLGQSNGESSTASSAPSQGHAWTSGGRAPDSPSTESGYSDSTSSATSFTSRDLAVALQLHEGDAEQDARQRLVEEARWQEAMSEVGSDSNEWAEEGGRLSGVERSLTEDRDLVDSLRHEEPWDQMDVSTIAERVAQERVGHVSAPSYRSGDYLANALVEHDEAMGFDDFLARDFDEDARQGSLVGNDAVMGFDDFLARDFDEDARQGSLLGIDPDAGFDDFLARDFEEDAQDHSLPENLDDTHFDALRASDYMQQAALFDALTGPVSDAARQNLGELADHPWLGGPVIRNGWARSSYIANFNAEQRRRLFDFIDRENDVDLTFGRVWEYVKKAQESNNDTSFGPTAQEVRSLHLEYTRGRFPVPEDWEEFAAESETGRVVLVQQIRAWLAQEGHHGKAPRSSVAPRNLEYAGQHKARILTFFNFWDKLRYVGIPTDHYAVSALRSGGIELTETKVKFGSRGKEKTVLVLRDSRENRLPLDFAAIRNVLGTHGLSPDIVPDDSFPTRSAEVEAWLALHPGKTPHKSLSLLGNYPEEHREVISDFVKWWHRFHARGVDKKKGEAYLEVFARGGVTLDEKWVKKGVNKPRLLRLTLRKDTSQQVHVDHRAAERILAVHGLSPIAGAAPEAGVRPHASATGTAGGTRVPRTIGHDPRTDADNDSLFGGLSSGAEDARMDTFAHLQSAVGAKSGAGVVEKRHVASRVAIGTRAAEIRAWFEDGHNHSRTPISPGARKGDKHRLRGHLRAFARRWENLRVEGIPTGAKYEPIVQALRDGGIELVKEPVETVNRKGERSTSDRLLLRDQPDDRIPIDDVSARNIISVLAPAPKPAAPAVVYPTTDTNVLNSGTSAQNHPVEGDHSDIEDMYMDEPWTQPDPSSIPAAEEAAARNPIAPSYHHLRAAQIDAWFLKHPGRTPFDGTVNFENHREEVTSFIEWWSHLRANGIDRSNRVLLDALTRGGAKLVIQTESESGDHGFHMVRERVFLRDDFAQRVPVDDDFAAQLRMDPEWVRTSSSSETDASAFATQESASFTEENAHPYDRLRAAEIDAWFQKNPSRTPHEGHFGFRDGHREASGFVDWWHGVRVNGIDPQNRVLLNALTRGGIVLERRITEQSGDHGFQRIHERAFLADEPDRRAPVDETFASQLHDVHREWESRNSHSTARDYPARITALPGDLPSDNGLRAAEIDLWFRDHPGLVPDSVGPVSPSYRHGANSFAGWWQGLRDNGVDPGNQVLVGALTRGGVTLVPRNVRVAADHGFPVTQERLLLVDDPARRVPVDDTFARQLPETRREWSRSSAHPVVFDMLRGAEVDAWFESHPGQIPGHLGVSSRRNMQNGISFVSWWQGLRDNGVDPGNQVLVGALRRGGVTLVPRNVRVAADHGFPVTQERLLLVDDAARRVPVDDIFARQLRAVYREWDSNYHQPSQRNRTRSRPEAGSHASAAVGEKRKRPSGAAGDPGRGVARRRVGESGPSRRARTTIDVPLADDTADMSIADSVFAALLPSDPHRHGAGGDGPVRGGARPSDETSDASGTDSAARSVAGDARRHRGDATVGEITTPYDAWTAFAAQRPVDAEHLLADVAVRLPESFGATRDDIQRAYGRLPAEHRSEPVTTQATRIANLLLTGRPRTGLLDAGAPASRRGVVDSDESLRQELASFSLGPLTQEPRSETDETGPRPTPGTGVSGSLHRSAVPPDSSRKSSVQHRGPVDHPGTSGVRGDAPVPRPVRQLSETIQRRKSSAVSDPSSVSRKTSAAQKLRIATSEVRGGLEGGIPNKISERLRVLTDKHQVVISFRLTSFDALPWNEHGSAALPKPEAIKAKSATWADTYLGIHGGFVGLVVNYRPRYPDLQELQNLTTQQQEKVWSTYISRLRESVVLAADMKKVEGRFKVDEYNLVRGLAYADSGGEFRKPHRTEADGSVFDKEDRRLAEKWYPITADFDLMQVADTNGNPVDEKTKSAFIEEALELGLIEHPDHLGWNPTNARGMEMKEFITKATDSVVTFAPYTSPFVEKFPPNAQDPMPVATPGESTPQSGSPAEVAHLTRGAVALHDAVDRYERTLNRLAHGSGSDPDVARRFLAQAEALRALNADPFTPWGENAEYLPALRGELMDGLSPALTDAERLWYLGALLAVRDGAGEEAAATLTGVLHSA
ncbi:toxin glutamine deamidase domain-containing protein [Streptomyces sp. NPDC001068]|uniref:toxin glutamine deamidase domain-containing protein n=1 Tax=Streptomyces sp. NPDC001068 TaxID=3364544 RepID=UPI0036AB9F28